jgi:hypothetical protein
MGDYVEQAPVLLPSVQTHEAGPEHHLGLSTTLVADASVSQAGLQKALIALQTQACTERAGLHRSLENLERLRQSLVQRFTSDVHSQELYDMPSAELFDVPNASYRLKVASADTPAAAAASADTATATIIGTTLLQNCAKVVVEEQTGCAAIDTAITTIANPSIPTDETISGPHQCVLPEESANTCADTIVLVRNLERNLSVYMQQATMRLDEHASLLASLRVRIGGQEQRLTATTDRVDTAVLPAIEALRLDVAQLRDCQHHLHDNEAQTLDHRMRSVEEVCEDTASELRCSLDKLSMRLEALISKCDDDRSAARKLLAAVKSQEHVIRQAEEAVVELQGDAVLQKSEHGTMLSMQVESLEHRVQGLENEQAEIESKANYTDVVRLDLSMRELADPLRRLSQRSAVEEAKTAGLERRLDQLQQQANAFLALTAPKTQPSDTRLEIVFAELSSVAARVLDLEGLLECRRPCQNKGSFPSKD